MSIFQKWVRVPLGNVALLARSRLLAPWRFHIPPSEQGCFHKVMEGQCWLRPKHGAPLHLKEGDFVLVTHKAGHDLAHPLGHTRVHSIEDLAKAAGFTPAGSDGSMAHGVYLSDQTTEAPGEATSLLNGIFAREAFRSESLLRILPPLIHLPAKHLRENPVIDSILSLLSAEAFDERAAALPPTTSTAALTEHLLGSLFIYAARLWAELKVDPASGPILKSKMMGGVRDEAVGNALSLMHAEPARQWTVATLAAATYVSRAAFARRFSAAVGEPPYEYLTRWRVALAERALRQTDLTVSQAALSVGYESASAFGRTFKRITGRSPRGTKESPRSRGG